MTDPRPNNSAEAKAVITLYVDKLASEFRAKYGIRPDRVRIGYLADLWHGHPLFNNGDEIAGCYVERNDATSYDIETGIWLP